ncbi:MAG: hypothetical protein A4E63_00377 [Syntrophorhabdus sp. PtaU1.Bin050]|nr:MAG: hypothetical protein A4E63_00377 [Syntrophorhabdus sp. PtaU1.Bin050]
MPLMFKSLSHGEIPFGFFNIEIDMILLDNYFFFASDMAAHVVKMAAEEPNTVCTKEWDVYVLDEAQIGNLLGAISGVDLRGFIGEVYSRFPFPCDPDEFKQNPDGCARRELVEEIVRRYATRSRIAVVIEPNTKTIRIGQYLFDDEGFHHLLNYLWIGGYPRWKADTRPAYIIEMKRAVEISRCPFFRNTAFD